MKKAGLGVLLVVILSLLGSNARAQTCKVLDPESPPDGVAGLLDGLGCVVGFADAQLDWTLSGSQIGSRDIVLDLEAEEGTTVTLLSSAGEELGSVTAAGGEAQANWVLAPGNFRLRINNPGNERYVISTGRGTWRTSLETDDRGADRRSLVRGQFSYTGRLESSPYYVSWTLLEGVGTLWEVLLNPGPGVPLNVKLFGPEGEMLRHVTGEPGQAAIIPPATYVPGVYTFVVPAAGWSGAAMRIDTIPVGEEAAAGIKTGRPGTLATANRISLPGVSGSLAEDPRDYYRLELQPDQAGLYDVTAGNSTDMELCFGDREGNQLACHRGTDISVHNVWLNAGPNYMFIQGNRQNEDAYSLRFVPVAGSDPAQAIGPAGTQVAAHLMKDSVARLTLGARTTTWLAADVTEPGLYRVQLQGAALVEIEVLDGGGSSLRRHRPASGESVLRIDNVPLRQGLNYIRLDGNAGDYAVRILRVGDLPAEHVVVPPAEGTDEIAARPEGSVVASVNMSSQTSAEIRPGIPYVTTTMPAEETAYYRFSLMNGTRVRLTLTAPQGSGMRLYRGRTVIDTDGPDNTAVIDDWLPAGQYDVQVRSLGSYDGWYQLQLDLLDPFDLTGGLYVPPRHRPLDVASDLRIVQAEPLPGRSFYRLPEIPEPTTMTVTFNPENRTRIVVTEHGSGTEVPAAERQDGHMVFDLEAGDYLLRLEEGMPWDVQLAFDPGPEPSVSTLRDDVEARLELVDEEIAAWSYWGQRTSGMLRISNSGDADYELEVLTHATDPRVAFPLAGDVLHVPAGGSLELPVELTLPADIASTSALELSYGLADGSGQTVTARTRILPSCGAPLVGGHTWWPVPESLLGRMNVAWQPWGAQLDTGGNTSDISMLDGRISPSQPPVRSAPYTYTLDLGTARELVATALHPLGAGSPADRASNFQIDVSEDGENWETVLQDRLLSANIEQFFMFREPLTTRHIRLTVIGSHGGSGYVNVGEWKLLSESSPERPNIAAAALGGHVVTSDPLLPARQPFVQDPRYGGTPTRTEASIPAGEALPSWIMGFHNNRAARISSITLTDSDREQNVGRVGVSVSTDSPLGPWETLADWQLEREDGSAVLQLDEPVWARFLKFEVMGEPQEGRVTYQLPLLITVTEADDYPSILGEWGFDSSWSYYEYSNPDFFTEATVGFGSNGSRESALLLETTETGYVQTGVAESWYRLVMPEDMNQLRIGIQSEPGVILGYELHDADGQLVDSGLSDGGSFRVSAEPGTEWWVRVFEPPRSVMFVWDNSGSVSPYRQQIYAALETFAGAIRGDMESVMLHVFSEPANFLLPVWSSDAAEVSRAINAYDRQDDSSDAELALLNASSALKGRQGVRAVVLITDAESGSYNRTADLWSDLAVSGAQVYALEVSSAGSYYAQDLMQDWAAANGGHYYNAADVASLENGFARADCLIRRAKYHEVSVEFSQRSATPAVLSVVQEVPSGDAPALASTGGILVILDASGSMYRTLDGRYRYEIAKDVLTGLVRDVLPDDAPFALRVFGNREANVCRSDLEVPLAPLDRASTAGIIAGVVPQSFAGTPIAASLQAAAADLGEADGLRQVILITDGEESCDGDVEAAIGQLVDAGFDVTLNVIGFDFDAEDPEAARERFRSWAALGGGEYFDATSADELAGALESSVSLPYEVLDATGQVVARGTVNGPGQQLEGGNYTVRVLAGEPMLFENVEIDGESVTLSVQ